MYSCLLPNSLWRTRVKPYAVCLFGGSSTAINKTVVLCHHVGGRLLLPSKHRHPPVGGMPWPREAKGAKEAINLLCFMDPTLKSKNDYIHNTYRIPKKKNQKNKRLREMEKKNKVQDMLPLSMCNNNHNTSTLSRNTGQSVFLFQKISKSHSITNCSSAWNPLL